VAEGVSALGLFVTALQQGASAPRTVLLPALIRFGLAEKPVTTERTMIKSPISQADVELNKQKVQALYSGWKQQPEVTSSRDQLREAVKELKLNAEVAGDAAVVKSSEASLRAIDASLDPMKMGVTDALAVIAPTKPAEAPTLQVMQLIDAPSAKVDQELLDIFLEEADEVVTTIRENLALIRQSSHDKNPLTTIRRGYHTLKGSGRMVGLTDLGEVAWSCEQVLNKWLKNDKNISTGLISLISESSDSFADWVGTLHTTGTAAIDGTRINMLCELLKNDKDPASEIAFVPSPILAPTVTALEEPSSTIVELDVTPVEAAVELPIIIDFVAEMITTPDLSQEPTQQDSPTAMVADAPSGMTTSPDIFDELPALAESLTDSSMTPQSITSAGIESFNAADDDEIMIGHVRLSQPLFEIYLGESDAHVKTLDAEMALIEANRFARVSHEFMRAAHTLASSSGTTGFNSIADVASSLEKWLTVAIEFAPEFDAQRLVETRQAVDALANMVLSLHAQEYPSDRADVAIELNKLRENLKT
ncbi:MAG: Hpt domain-containing protein, partial [Pseudomonadota bacterium]